MVFLDTYAGFRQTLNCFLFPKKNRQAAFPQPAARSVLNNAITLRCPAYTEEARNSVSTVLSALPFLSEFAGRVFALHIHDNNYLRDHHQLPFTGKFDWLKITEALKEIGYQGDFTLETSLYHYNTPDDFVEDALEISARTARYLASKIED